MIVYIENESEIIFDFENPEELIKTAVYAVSSEMGIPGCLDVNVIITSEEEIQRINSEFRNRDSVTDVLSFPFFEYDKPGVFGCNINESGENILGDIVICAQRVISQSCEYGHSQRRELAFLTVHSMLHLIGYDHESEGDAVLMQAQEKEIMKLLDIPR